jgi:hypothetical protein
MAKALRTRPPRILRIDVPTWDVVATARTDRSDAYKAVEDDIYMDAGVSDEPVAHNAVTQHKIVTRSINLSYPCR